MAIDIDEVRKQLDIIREHAFDDEVAHGKEDGLRDDVLHAIAQGMAGDAAAELAKEVLKSSGIVFSRWCA